MIYFFSILLLLVVLIVLNPAFGKMPSGLRKQKLQHLFNYRSGALHNVEPTLMKPSGVSNFDMVREVFFKKHPNRVPSQPLPFKEPNWQQQEPAITWFGHSSYLLQVSGINILVDPLISRRASPFQWIGAKAFDGTEFLTLSILPKKVDIVILTHDHYDHLDYTFCVQFKQADVLFITSLGVGAHLEKWGVKPEQIIELSWGEQFQYASNMTIHTETSRHFTGRGLIRNQSLWSSFVLQTPEGNYFLGGDSGYGSHFKEIGDKYGEFELAILECGQYNTLWPSIHMFPEETVQAARNLNAKKLMPVHWAKFSLSTHPWKEPVDRVVASALQQKQALLIPYMGETVVIGTEKDFENWWQSIK